MVATLSKAEVFVSEDELTSVRHEVESESVGLKGFAAVMTNGEARVLPPELSKIIAQAFHALATNGSVTVGTLPEELTSNTAAEILGVSRPTLLKMAKNGELESVKVGSHTRFKRSELMSFKEKREASRRKEFMEMRELREALGESS